MIILSFVVWLFAIASFVVWLFAIALCKPQPARGSEAPPSSPDAER